MGYSPPPTPPPPPSSPSTYPVSPPAEGARNALQSAVETLLCCRFFASRLIRSKTTSSPTTPVSAGKPPPLSCRGASSPLQHTLQSVITAASSLLESPRTPDGSRQGLAECEILVEFAVGPADSIVAVRDSGELQLLERWSLRLVVDDHTDRNSQMDARGGCAALSVEERETALALRNIAEESIHHPAVEFTRGLPTDAFELKSYNSFRQGDETGSDHCFGKICDRNEESLYYIVRNAGADKCSRYRHNLSFDGLYTEDKLRPIKLRSSTIVPVVYYSGQPGRVDTLSPVTEEYLRSEGRFYESPLGASTIPSHSMLHSEATASPDHQPGHDEAEIAPRNLSLLTRLLHMPASPEGESQAPLLRAERSFPAESFSEHPAPHASEENLKMDCTEDGPGFSRRSLLSPGAHGVVDLENEESRSSEPESFFLAPADSPMPYNVSPLIPEIYSRHLKDLSPTKMSRSSMDPGWNCVFGGSEDAAAARSPLHRSSSGSEDFRSFSSELCFSTPTAYEDEDNCSVPSCTSSLSTSSDMSLLSTSPSSYQGQPFTDKRYSFPDNIKRALFLNDVYGEKEFNLRTKYRRTFHSSASKDKSRILPPLRGSLEESLLGAAKPGNIAKSEIHGFQMHISLASKSAKFISPSKLTLPLKLQCFRDNDVPIHFGKVDIEEISCCETPRVGSERREDSDSSSLRRRIRIPRVGCIQVVIVNPEGTPIKRIPVDYDMSDMPRGTKTFIRYKQFLKDGGTRIAFHFKIYSSKRSGRLYLYHEIRLFFSMTNVEGDFKELEKVVTYPVDPKYFSV